MVFVMLLVLLQLCRHTSALTYNEFKTFFKTTWAPMICDIHQTSSDVMGTFMDEICKELDLLPAAEVWDRTVHFVLLHMPYFLD